MRKSVLCLVDNHGQADRLVEKLLSSSFVAKDISILVAEGPTSSSSQNKIDYTPNPQDRIHELGTKDSTKLPEGSAAGAWTGGVIGSSLGLLAGIGTLAIPGLGVFIVAGPIVAALSGSAVGGLTGLLFGAIAGYGIPEYEVKRYEEGVEKGKVLLAVLTRNADQTENAKMIMQEVGAESISISTEIK